MSKTRDTGMRRQAVIASIVILLQLVLCTATDEESLATVNVSPYLLFTTTVRIYRMNLDGSGVEVLVYEQNPGILGLEYHYRFNLLFWTNTLDPSIKQANLDGSNVRKIVTSGPGDLELRYPVDLALDWINNKLYWTDRDVKKIGVYDLVTAERRVILSTGSDSLLFGLAVYPYPHYGWLYWVDRGKETLEVATVTGEGRRVLESGRRLNCAWPLTLEYTDHTIYWINHCDFRMHSINMDGSQNTRSQHVRNIHFPYGISILNGTVFWTQHLSVCTVDLLQRKPVTHIIQTLSSEGGTRGIEAVHPMQQPTAEVFREIVDTGTAECDPPCANGDCVDPGLCYCDRGWTGLDCLTDINECEISNGGCDHNCANFIGNFECTCREGYTLKNDSKGCRDVNECGIANGGCQQRCINVLGSFKAQCVCFEGYSLNENMTCEDINECNTSNGVCEHNCTNLEGSYECTCPGELIVDVDGRSCVCFDGFGLSGNMTCEDINECEILNGGCEYNCTNSEGSYECSCLADFVLGIDGRSCTCLDGYATKDNITCEDINECEISNGGCDHNCSNSKGSYECSCLPHFVLNLDDRSCNDIDECLIANGGCPQLCINLPGSYECGCFDGYNMIEVTICEDINECKSFNGGCLHNCTNLEGSYECSCLEGFTLGIDGRNCEDINECESLNGGCLHNCTNLEGSYECSCLEGFILSIDSRNCDAVVETTTFPTPTPTSLVLATSPATSIPTLPPDETSPVLAQASRSSTSITPSFVTNPQQNSTPHPSPTIPPRPLPSSSRPITASSSSSSHKISGFVNPSQSSATVPALQSPPITTSNTQIPVDTDHSISTTHTRPSMSMDSSPPPDIAEPKASSSTMIVIVAAAASAGVIVLAVLAVIIASMVTVYHRRAHKSGSWSPPRIQSATDSPTDSIKFTGSVTATTAVDFKAAT